jgi:hypothetical protein
MFSVEFLICYDRNQIKAFAYVRRDDGGDIPDGEYDVREGEDERRQVEEVGWEVANKVASPMEPAILTDVVKKGAFAGVPLE